MDAVAALDAALSEHLSVHGFQIDCLASNGDAVGPHPFPTVARLGLRFSEFRPLSPGAVPRERMGYGAMHGKASIHGHFRAVVFGTLRSRVIRQTGRLLEVCDPVENYTYSVDGVSGDDFTLPSGLVGIRRPR